MRLHLSATSAILLYCGGADGAGTATEFFLVLQNSEIGGELTIYDMHWKDIKHKDSIEENNYVLDPGGKRVYLDALRSFYVKPNPGDILIFSGGPIWHRVENIRGKNPRITFGGFLNFTPDDKGLRYWG